MTALLVLTILASSSPDISKALYECQELARSTNVGISGSYIFRLKTNDMGRVLTVSMVKDDVHSPVLARCMRHKLLGLVLSRKGQTFDIKLEVPKMLHQHSVWLNNVPMVRSVSRGVFIRPLIYKENTGLDVPHLAVVKFDKAGTLPAHFHMHSGVFLHVLQGELSLSWQAGRKVKSAKLVKGASAYIPKMASHELKSDDGAIILIFFEKPDGFDWLRGKISKTTRVLPPPSVPMTGTRPDPRAGNGVVTKPPQTMPGGRHVRRKRLLSRGGLTLELVHGPKGSNIAISGSSFSGFVLTGGGKVSGDGDQEEVLRAGSGIAASSTLHFYSMTPSYPFTAVILRSGRLSVKTVRRSKTRRSTRRGGRK